MTELTKEERTAINHAIVAMNKIIAIDPTLTREDRWLQTEAIYYEFRVNVGLKPDISKAS